MRPVSGLMTRAGGMNEDLRNAVSIHLRASLVPAAAVIPAQVAYFDVVAVKKLVVGWQPGSRSVGVTFAVRARSSDAARVFRTPRK